MLVGETPGDREDLAGHVFVGPAGHLLDRALDAAGLERGELYLTNAVKHFRFRERGKRRIHQTPTAEHVNACRPWLEAEIAVVKPRVLVLMGAVAAHSLLGSKVRVTVDRGQMDSDIAERVFVTVHPSSIVRIEDSAERRAAFDVFVSDLRTAVGDA
jgi:uracil-DNA glycosylase